MLTIITYPPGIFSSARIKGVLKLALGRQSGPRGVLESLKRGLKENGVPFQINPPTGRIKNTDIVHVPSGVDALRYALRLKREGKISKLIAGPNISVLPADYGGILLDEAIDIILQPSEWTKDLYLFLAPSLEKKVKVWAAGVSDASTIPSAQEMNNKRNEVLIFQKNAPDELVAAVETLLGQENFVYKKIVYGSFKMEEYFKLLDACKFMIYLSPSESQGLAIHQSWMRDVPTFVWDRGYFEYAGGKRFEAANISAPYLTSRSGMSFHGQADLEEKFSAFIQRLPQFDPRAYSLELFTDKKSALAYLGEIM